MAEQPPPPHRRLRLQVDLEADDLDTLTGALREIALDLHIEDREQRVRVSGGYSAGYDLTLTCDQEQTGDRFRQQLEAWTEERRAREETDGA